ncbi:MAG: M48 family metalloprotease [Myxococcales bacterium]|nr:M48 family metalloprotease [Myxococcales bacterium]
MIVSLASWLALAAVAVAVVVAGVVALAWPRLAPRLRRLRPARRARALSWLALAPLIAAAGLVVACVLPSLYAALWPALDHCTRHADEHLHLCLAHPPAHPLGALLGLLVVGAAGVVVLRLGGALARFGRAHRVLARVRRASVGSDAADVRSVDSEAPFSFAAGILRPAIFVSRGLRDRVSAEVLAAVLAHERAHLRRRDLLRRYAATLAATLHGPRTGEAILDELELACEEACDAEAAATLDDPGLVAAAIVAVARLRPRLRPLAALAEATAAFAEDALSRRVHALLEVPSESAERPPRRGSLALFGLALLILAPALHHLTESTLSALAHS